MALTAVLNRWEGILRELGIKDPKSSGMPDGVRLRVGRQLVQLMLPRYAHYYPTPVSHPFFGNANLVTADQRMGDSFIHTLYVTTQEAPYAASIRRGDVVRDPVLSARAMLNICMNGQLIRP